MSQSTIVKSKSSPCCIGCIVAVVIALGFAAAFGIYIYKFASKNISIIDVSHKIDPAVDTPPEILLPQKVGSFERISLMDSNKIDAKAKIPEIGDMNTSGALVAVYEDSLENSLTVFAAPTARLGRNPTNFSDSAISIHNPFTGDKTSRTFVAWAKTNWTFAVQTTSTLANDFVADFNPGTVANSSANTGTQE